MHSHRVKVLPAWLISQCFISVRKDVKWNHTETARCTPTCFHTKTFTGSTPRHEWPNMADTQGLIIFMLLILLEKLLSTNSKGVVAHDVYLSLLMCFLMLDLFSFSSHITTGEIKV